MLLGYSTFACTGLLSDRRITALQRTSSLQTIMLSTIFRGTDERRLHSVVSSLEESTPGNSMLDLHHDSIHHNQTISLVRLCWFSGLKRSGESQDLLSACGQRALTFELHGQDSIPVHFVHLHSIAL